VKEEEKLVNVEGGEKNYGNQKTCFRTKDQPYPGGHVGSIEEGGGKGARQMSLKQNKEEKKGPLRRKGI